MGKLAAFIDAHRIRMTCNYVDSNPNMERDDWARSATHWACEIKRGKARFSTFFSQGSAHTGEPTLADVLDCLASDAQGVESADFEEWASELGYDTDSRKAESTFKACKRTAAGLRRLLGDEAFEVLLYETERL